MSEMFPQPIHLNSAARLDVIIGGMFSGKSSALLRKLSQLTDLGLGALYINHGIDNRATTNFSTHSSILKNNDAVSRSITTIKVCNLNDLPADIDINSFDVIGVDEAQFFGNELVPFVLNLVEKLQKYVIVAGLDGNFCRQKFGNIFDLIPLADNVTKLTAFCRPCANDDKILRPALFSHYTAATTNGQEGTVIVGGADKYEPVCRACYLKLTKERALSALL